MKKKRQLATDGALQKAGGSMKVSACTIVKNEARNLPRWLRCMQALADEIVVVDTGSTDDTVAIAQAAGARVAHFPWRNDFAAAKNFALDQVTGDWVLLLDADEFFPEVQWPAVRAALAQYDAQYEVIGLVCDLVNFDEDQHFRRLSAICQLRIFRRLPDLRYERPIHEMLCYRGREHRLFQYVPGLTIYHTGYSSRLAAAKTRRNLALLQARQAAGEAAPEDAQYLADCYYELGEYEQAAHYAAQAVQGETLKGAGNHLYLLWYFSLEQLGRPAAERAAVVAVARQRFPQQAEFVFLEGELAWQTGDYRHAVARYHAGLAMYAQREAAKEQAQAGDVVSAAAGLAQAQQEWLSDDATALLPQIYARLARLARWRGQLAQAFDYVTAGLQRDRYVAALVQELLRLSAGQADADCQATLAGLYQLPEDAGFLSDALAELSGARYCQLQRYYAQLQAGAQAETLQAADSQQTAQTVLDGVRAHWHLAQLAATHGVAPPALVLLRPQSHLVGIN